MIDVLDVLKSSSFKEGFHFQEQKKSDGTRTGEYSGWLIANMPQLASMLFIIMAHVLSRSRIQVPSPHSQNCGPPLKTCFNKFPSTCNKTSCFCFRQKLFVDCMLLKKSVQKWFVPQPS